MTRHDCECVTRVRHAKIGSIYYYLKESCNFSVLKQLRNVITLKYLKTHHMLRGISRMPRQKVNETQPWLVRRVFYGNFYSDFICLKSIKVKVDMQIMVA